MRGPIEHILFLFKRLVSACMRKMQGLSAYRQIAPLFKPEITIKEADEQEDEAIQDWFNPGQERRSAPQPNPNVTNWVAKKGERIIGFIQLLRHTPEHQPYVNHWLSSLRVRGHYRGLGIGEALSRIVIETARQEGAGELLLIVREDNLSAIQLYRKLGFEVKAIPILEERLEKEKHSLGHKSVSMVKLLNGER